MKKEYSALIGIVGGVVDLIAGISLLQSTTMMGSEYAIMNPNAIWAGYFLVGLGVVVLVTGVYISVTRMMNSPLIGALMLVYGIVMYGLGIGMLVRLFSLMQYSAISGVVMLLVGTAMLFSGYDMRRKMDS